ncbi:MAG TPA: polysaccharide biosynthesis tyrosine autokinase [Puia sp.]|jgi:capsular exopolysaccharide synthesis family protein|nr:polysaccharide biosynthesis tyrosine autokinase [Puia sp.]
MSTSGNFDEEITPRSKPIFDNRWTISPRDFFFKYLRYLPWVLISCVILFLVAYIKIRYTVQIFRVQSSLLIKDERDFGDKKDARFEELFMSPGTTNLSNEMEVLKSRPLIARVVKDLNLQVRYYNKGKVRTGLLYPDVPFYLNTLKVADSSVGFGLKIKILDSLRFLIDADKTVYLFGQTLQSGGNSFSLIRNPAVGYNSFGTPEFEVDWVPVPGIAEYLISSIRVAQSNEQSTILNLNFEGENIRLGKDVLNTLMSVYDTMIVEDKNRIASNTLKFINDRLVELNDTLRNMQGGLKAFMVQNQVFDVENQSKGYLDRLDESAKQKTEMEVKVGIVDFLLKYVADKKNMHELVPTNLGIEEPALMQLVAGYNQIQLERDNNMKTTPATNPLIIGMDNTLDKIRRDIYQALLNVKQAYSIADEKIDRRFAELQGNITSLPGKSMQLLNKERQQKILEDIYSLLLQKKLDISLSSASTISNSKVLEPALGNPTPTSPDTKKTYTMYLLVGLLIPIGIIVLKEQLQDKVRGRVDIERLTNAPILGEIGHSETDYPLVVTRNSRKLIAEQFRIIRTNLQYIIGKNERPVIMVTSSFSGEGKSFISTNMGAVMALSGKKTVIMEFDIRKPKIISGLDLKRKMGITNYIIGKASFEDLLVKVDNIDGLYIIPCGPIPPNPAELLLDRRLDDLMKEVTANFEVVILDTAPIGLVSDATTLGNYADCSMYIVRQGHTFRKQVGFIEELYKAKKIPKLSLILNDVKVEGGYYGSKYGYYGGYGYGTASGYFEDEDGRKKKKKRFGLFGLFSRK